MPIVRRSGNTRGKASAKSAQAPVAGLNFIDSIQALKPSDALILDNWIATPGSITGRAGKVTQNTVAGTGGVRTIAGYSSGTNQRLFAGAGTTLYDVTTVGAPTAQVGALGSVTWQQAQFTTPGGTFLYLVNGVDAPLLYNGIVWQAVTNVSAPIAITGVNPALLNNVTVHQNRLWFAEKDSLRCWYLGVASVGGSATLYDFGPRFRLGGRIVGIATWSVDAGNNFADRLVVATSNGEYAVYSGTDPASDATWQLNGLYYAGSPLGPRCFQKVGGDLAVLSQDGLFLLSSLLQSTRVSSTQALSYRITPYITRDTTLFRDQFGWQVILFPGNNVLLVNVPDTGTSIRQWVINTITRGWSSFSNLHALCWWWWNEELWYGDSQGNVFKALEGSTDNGTTIVHNLVTAFNYAERYSNLKHWQGIRINGAFPVGAEYFAELLTDFQIYRANNSPQYLPIGQNFGTGAASWDVSLWDSGATWASGGTEAQVNLFIWNTFATIGYSAATHLMLKSRFGPPTLASIDYLVEFGGVF